MLELILGAGLVVKAVLALLIALSVSSWAIIAYKVRELGAAERATGKFLGVYQQGTLTDARESARAQRASPLSRVFHSGYSEVERLHEARGKGAIPDDQVERVVQHLGWTQTEEAHRLERGLAFLATTGSSAPFIGLFGTVIGIMNAFEQIGSTGSASLSVVAPGMVEALIATAVGLFAAIPAVIAYNYVGARVGRIVEQTEAFRAEYAARLRRTASTLA